MALESPLLSRPRRDQDTDHPTSIRLYYPCGLKGKDLIEDVTYVASVDHGFI